MLISSDLSRPPKLEPCWHHTSGHGLSSHRSPDSSYHIWDDVPQLIGIVDQLDLETVHVVGHSRGAGIAGVLAVALGERCATVTMLDGMISRSFENDDGAELFRSSLSEKGRSGH